MQNIKILEEENQLVVTQIWLKLLLISLVWVLQDTFLRVVIKIKKNEILQHITDKTIMQQTSLWCLFM